MKWKNIDIGAYYYYVTGISTEWLPLLNNAEARRVVCEEIGKAQYAAWKEQTRDLAIWSKQKLYAMVDYIHANPVRKRLVEHPGDWAFSSWRFYEAEGCADFEIVPPVV